MAETRIHLLGPVRCLRTPPPLALTLSGAAAPPDSGTLTLAFAGAAPEDLPAKLTDVLVESAADGGYRLTSAGRSWSLAATGLTVMRAVAREFYGALPPRPVPSGKRLFWRLALALAASRTGLALLRALRR